MSPTNERPAGGRDDATADAPLSARERALAERLESAERKLRGIEAISRALVSQHDLRQIVAIIMEHTSALLQAERTTLYVVEDDGSRLWSVVAMGGETLRIELDMGQGLAGWTAAEGRPINIKDAYQDRRFDRSFDEHLGYRTRSVLCWPVKNASGHVVGVIQVLNRREGYFTPEDEELLAAIASQAAITIQNSNLYLATVGQNIELMEATSRLKRSTQELEVLFAIERAAAVATTREEALSSVLRETLDSFPYELITVALRRGPEDDTFVYHTVVGAEAERLAAPARDAPPTAIRAALERREAVVYTAGEAPPELAADLQARHPDWALRTVVTLPILHQDHALGALQLINPVGGGSDRREEPARELRLLGIIARRLGLSLWLARAQEEEKKAERLAAIGQMLSSVVHDLKTPLTIINGYAQLMARADDADQRAHFKALVERQIAQVKTMTTELLAFARGESKVLLRKVHLHTFLSEVRELLLTEFEGSGVTLDLDLQVQGAVRMDEGKMKRVVFNLARNAREAMPGGGVFRVSVEQTEDEVVFSFADTGPGLPEAMRGRLFESFATHGKEHGTGLGLAIVKKIVDEHGGSITWESSPGQGTVFHLHIPSESAGAPPRERAA